MKWEQKTTETNRQMCVRKDRLQLSLIIDVKNKGWEIPNTHKVVNTRTDATIQLIRSISKVPLSWALRKEHECLS